MNAVIKVFIVDDHAILRSGLKMLIDSQADMQTVGDASNVTELFRVLGVTDVDVVILDIGLPAASGLKALASVHEAKPHTKVLVLTMHRELALMRSALSSGASGFLSKQGADTDLISAIRAVHKGGLFLDPSLAKGLFPAERARVQSKSLSRREAQVVQLFARGYSNQDIAQRIQVSVKTVETYRARIAEKFGLRTRFEIVRYAIASGLLTTDDFLQDTWAA